MLLGEDDVDDGDDVEPIQAVVPQTGGRMEAEQELGG